MRTSVRAVLLLVLYLHIEVHGEPEPDAAPAHGRALGHHVTCLNLKYSVLNSDYIFLISLILFIHVMLR